MRIGFDTTPLYSPPCGVRTYTANLLASLQAEPADEVVALTHPTVHLSAARSVQDRSLQVNKLLSVFWMQLLLPRRLARLDLDICHFTNSVAPYRIPNAYVATIYDMTLWLFPEHHSRRRLLARRPFVARTARQAAAVVTISESSKRDIVRVLAIPDERVHVIYPAPPPDFRRLRDQARDLACPESQVVDRFILYVGTLEPRKNLVRLLEAFALLRRQGLRDHRLVLVGCRGWKETPIFEAVERHGLRDAVCFLGNVPTDSLVALYNRADAFVFPSLYEGFGLPVIEAMACGTPVVTSRRGSLEEVSGGAAEYVEPSEAESIANGLRRVLTDPARRAELREKGLVRAAAFNWQTAARRTRELYSQVRAG